MAYTDPRKLAEDVDALALPLLRQYDVEHVTQIMEIVEQDISPETRHVLLYQLGFKTAILFGLLGRLPRFPIPPSGN